MKDLQELKRDLLKNKDVKSEYDRLEPQYELIKQLISARINKRITQAEIAKKIGTGQSAVSRFESGDCNPSFEFLTRVATALDKKLVVCVE